MRASATSSLGFAEAGALTVSRDAPAINLENEKCVILPPARLDSPGHVSIRPGECRPSSAAIPGINYDEILDAVKKYPRYSRYFQEKLSKIERMRYLIKHKEQRAMGETKDFLEHWEKYFSTQIKNTLNWLLKKE